MKRKHWTPKSFSILALDLLRGHNMATGHHPPATLHTTLTLTRDENDKWHLEPNNLGWGDAFAPSSPAQAHTLYEASFGEWLGKWASIRGVDGRDANLAYSLARGSYQQAVASGIESVSTSTLRGSAINYRGRYRDSINAWLDRCRSAGVRYSIEPFGLGRRQVLVFGESVGCRS